MCSSGFCHYVVWYCLTLKKEVTWLAKVVDLPTSHTIAWTTDDLYDIQWERYKAGSSLGPFRGTEEELRVPDSVV